MKKFFLSLLVVVAAVAVMAPGAMAKDDHKVTICHATSSDTNPFVTITISENAVYGPGGHFNENGTTQAGHEQDYFGECRVTPPPVVDVCPNLEGNQETVPAGMVKDEQGNCVTPPVIPPVVPPVTPPVVQECKFTGAGLDGHVPANGNTNDNCLPLDAPKTVTTPATPVIEKIVFVDRIVEKIKVVTKTKTKVVFKVRYKTVKGKTIIKRVTVIRTVPKPDVPKKAPKTL